VRNDPVALSQAVLITGCSSGIGRAAALRLHQAGLPVYASARNPDSIADLAEQGIRTLQLDVTDEASTAAAVKAVTEEHGAVGALVNNAGSGVHGAVEDVALDTVRASFETNLFGTWRLTQLVLPGMRAQRAGRIVNMSSVLGRFSPPGGSVYHATKHAMEAFSESLRREVAPFGVKVSMIQPATVRTQFFATALMQFAGAPDSAYQAFYDKLANWAIEVHEGKNTAGKRAVTPEKVAEAIGHAVLDANPKSRYPIGPLAHGAFAMQRALPDGAFDSFIAKQFPAP
jgi:NAD(P)-dependent dehydrogenase (short-subunit alcohol dehydrogenase family)